MYKILFAILSIICFVLFMFQTWNIKLAQCTNGDVIIIILGCICWMVTYLEDIKKIK